MRKFPFLLSLLAFILSSQDRPLDGYALEGQKWPNGTITMNLQLSSATYPYPEQPGRGLGGLIPAPGLQDYSASWNDVAIAALTEWNQYLANVQFAWNENSLTPQSGDGINTVLFDSTAFGQGFGADAIAITVRWAIVSTNTTVEADVVVNTAYSWDSYRGDLQYPFESPLYDIRRVLDHEFGHVLGLDHPDLATPPQTVTAIMNSTTSDLDHIELDDISGVMFLYGQKTILEPVTVSATPTNGGTVSGGGNLQLASTQQLTATPVPGWAFDQWDDGETNPTRSIQVPLGGATYTATFARPLDAWHIVSDENIGNFGNVLFVNGTFLVFGTTGVTSSTDGATWTDQTPTVQVNYNPNAVAYHAGTFVSVGASGQIWTSSDGVNWTSRSSGVTGDLNAVTYGNGLFVAVGGTWSPGSPGPPPVVTSPDGITWTVQTQGIGQTINGYSSVIYVDKKFFAVGGQDAFEKGEILTSSDGVAWSVTGLSIYQPFVSITYGDGVFVACTQDNLFSSPDGVTWTQEISQSGYTYECVTYDNGLFLAMSNGFASSPDGVTWTSQSSNAGWISAVAYGKGKFVGAGPNGIYVSAVIPAGGQNWSPAVLSFQNGTSIGALTLNPTFLPSAWQGVGGMGSGWQQRAIADINGDGVDDIIFQNGTLIGALIMNANGTPSSWVGIGAMNAGWQLCGAADITDDGNLDLIFQNGTLLGFLEVNSSGQPVSWNGIGAMGAGWQLRAVTDFAGSGQPNLIFQNGTSLGALQVGTDGLPTAWNGIGAMGSGWTLSDAVDINGDGQPDLIFQNGTSLGALQVNTSFQPVAWHGIGAMSSGWTLPGDY